MSVIFHFSISVNLCPFLFDVAFSRGFPILLVVKEKRQIRAPYLPCSKVLFFFPSIKCDFFIPKFQYSCRDNLLQLFIEDQSRDAVSSLCYSLILCDMLVLKNTFLYFI